MIAIFTVLGLILTGGGAYAIYDGWPYLVLERGFTQVIIGSIASGSGLIMLCLAWVLKEVRAIRRALVAAIAPRADLSAPDVAVAEVAPAVTVAMPRAEHPSFSPAVAPAAVGAAAGALATGAAAHALAASEAESPPASAETPSSSGDRDLFGALVARNLQEQEAVAGERPEEASEPATASAKEAEPLPDMFGEALSAAPPQPARYPFTFEPDEQGLAEPVAATPETPAEEETFVGSDEPGASAHLSADAEADEPPPSVEPEAELDEFSALRASLAGHLNEPEREAGRVEPSFSAESDPFAEAETWMDRASPRREPWLGSPPVEDLEAVANEEAPVWPPRTEAPVFDMPVEPVIVDAEAEAGPDLPVREEADDAEPEVEPAPAGAEDVPAAADSRPASDEGIVGAYQVGDAHFTIYADGSIRARTPDGEYSFASMDELKVYLASEKSRLGV